ncbi:GumC family protein [Thermaurantiacus sp.]
MNLIQFLRILWARRWMAIIPALVALLVGLLISSLLPARYPATARLMLDTIRPDPVTGIGVGGRDSTGFIRTQLQFLTDDRVIGDAIDRLGLANDPATIARYADSGFSEEDGGIRRWLINQFRPRISAGIIGGSDIMEIKFEGQTPEIAKAVAGALRDAFVAETLRLKIDTANRTGAWYREQAAQTARDIAALEARRTAFMAENGIVLVQGPGSPDMETAKLQTLQAALSQAQASVSSQQVAVTASGAVNSVADQLRVQLSAIDEEIARASEQLGPQHPAYRAAVARRAVVQQQLNNAVRQQSLASGALVGASQAALERIEQQILAQQKIVQERKPLLDQLAVFDQDIASLRQSYQQQLERGNFLDLESKVQETSFVILGDPTAERTPSYPKRGLIASLSFVGGLGLGLLAALLLEFSARRVRGVEDLSYATGAPVLAHVGGRTRGSPRLGLQRLLGRRRRDDDAEGGELQAI